jgi:hypothetical protein
VEQKKKPEKNAAKNDDGEYDGGSDRRSSWPGGRRSECLRVGAWVGWFFIGVLVPVVMFNIWGKEDILLPAAVLAIGGVGQVMAATTFFGVGKLTKNVAYGCTVICIGYFIVGAVTEPAPPAIHHNTLTQPSEPAVAATVCQPIEAQGLTYIGVRGPKQWRGEINIGDLDKALEFLSRANALLMSLAPNQDEAAYCEELLKILLRHTLFPVCTEDCAPLRPCAELCETFSSSCYYFSSRITDILPPTPGWSLIETMLTHHDLTTPWPSLLEYLLRASQTCESDIFSGNASSACSSPDFTQNFEACDSPPDVSSGSLRLSLWPIRGRALPAYACILI